MGLRYKRLDLESTGPSGRMFLSQPAKGSDANDPVVPAPGVPGQRDTYGPSLSDHKGTFCDS